MADPGTPIEQVAALQNYLTLLRPLGYRTAEQFVGAARVVSAELSDYLNFDVNQVLKYIPAEIKGKTYLSGELRKFSYGVRLDSMPRRRRAFGVSAPVAGAPSSKSMISEMPDILDQGSRLTCVSFATLAVIEHRARIQGNYVPLSEQFLYWACKQKDGIPNDPGTWLEIAFEKVLSQDGCCLDSTWNYEPAIVAGDETRGSPPASAAAEALQHVSTTFKRLAPTSVSDIRSCLQKGNCVAFSIPVYHSWTLNPEVQKTGDIILPIPNEDDHNEGHAMCFVGYEDLPEDNDTGGGRFLVRNSWDSYWATGSKLGVGYGTIPYSYIAKFGSEAYSID